MEDKKLDGDISVIETTIKLKIKDIEIELTVDEAKRLRDELNNVLNSYSYYPYYPYYPYYSYTYILNNDNNKKDDFAIWYSSKGKYEFKGF